MRTGKGNRFRGLAMLLALGLSLSGAVLPALAEAESDVGDVTMEAVNEAYDAAMLETHSEMAFLTVPFLCQRLCDLMSFACGQAAEAADVAADNAALQVVDTLIRQAEQCFPGGERTADAEAFERAVAAWEGRREGFLAASGDVGGFEPGLRMDDARVGKLVDAICLQMPCETRLDYLESAQNVCTAIWPLLRQALLSKAGEALDVPERSRAWTSPGSRRRRRGRSISSRS